MFCSVQRFSRYPLIIDPSGQATEYILKQFADRKISQTSFLDDAFRKNLESSLRFGNPLLVQDVESCDPILDPVLNRYHHVVSMLVIAFMYSWVSHVTKKQRRCCKANSDSLNSCYFLSPSFVYVFV